MRLKCRLFILTLFSFSFTACGADTEKVDGSSADHAGPEPASQSMATQREAGDERTVAAKGDSLTPGGAHPGQTLYARCAACHLPDGSGVPGAFPPLGDNVVALADTAPGRDYLAKAVKTGLIGAIEIDGQTYSGAMPAHGPALGDEEIADVLNYIFESLNDRRAGSGFKPFTGEEIAAAAARRADLSPNETLALRKEALEAATP